MEKAKKEKLSLFERKSFRKRALKVKTENNRIGKLRLFIIIALILMQLSLLIYLRTQYVMAVKGVSVTCLVLSLITCIYVLSTNKNGQSKAVWIIFLLVCFTFGYIIFWLSNEKIVFGKAKKRYKAVYEKYEPINDSENLEFSTCSVKETSNLLYSAGKFKSYDKTNGEYFPSGELFFDDVIDEIKKAKKFIFLEFFIICDGILLDMILEQLIIKAKNGVDVRIIYDDLGSSKNFSHKTKKRIKDGGILLKPFNKLSPIFHLSHNFRDHRKIIVIDGKVAYTGGTNIADEYINVKKIHGYWKDNGVKITGQAVDGFTLIYLKQWEVLTKNKQEYSPFLNLYTEEQNKSIFIPYADGLEYIHPIGRSVYENMILSANKFLFIMTPYFVIDDGITNLIINKALSGIDVRIILPAVPDKKFVYTVTRSNAEKLIDYGVKVYTMKDSFVHSKVVLTEDAVSVGSINMDLRSFYQQFESALYTDDKKICDSVLEDFNNTFSKCEQITQKNKWSKNIFYRMFVGAMQVFAPFM